MNFKFISDFFAGLKSYSEPVVPNLRPDLPVNATPPLLPSKIVPEECFANSRPWKGIVIHHSATVDGKTNDWGAIQRYHMSFRIDGVEVNEETFYRRKAIGDGKRFEKPWRDIGYHGGWELVGNIYVFKVGRSWHWMGAHAGLPDNNSFNADYLGFCAVGNHDAKNPPAELWALAVATIREIRQRFNIPVEQVIGHREAYDRAHLPREKTCPGTKWDMEKFRSEL